MTCFMGSPLIDGSSVFLVKTEPMMMSHVLNTHTYIINTEPNSSTLHPHARGHRVCVRAQGSTRRWL